MNKVGKVRVGNTLFMMYKNEDYVITDYDALNYLLKTGMIVDNDGQYQITRFGLTYLEQYLATNMLSLYNYAISDQTKENNLNEDHIKTYIQSSGNKRL